MRSSFTTIARCVCLWGLIAFGSVASAQQPQLSLVVVDPPSGRIEPGAVVQIEVFVEGIVSPDALRAYQTTIEVVPQAGATGSLLVADPADLPAGLTEPVIIDADRTDWVFFGAGVSLPATDPSELQLGALLLFDQIEVPQPRYCGTYFLQASADALGDFEINFVLPLPGAVTRPTYLADLNNLFLDNLTGTGATVGVVELAAGDVCADAPMIGGGVIPFTTLNASTDGPALPATCDEGTGNGLSFENDVWFEHVASCSGTLTISTCNDADFDTRLAVYGNGGSTCFCPTDNTSLIDCSDDVLGCGDTSEVILSATEGECFTIRVGSSFGTEGSGNLTITCAPDLCQNASPLAAGESILGSTENTVVNDNIGPVCSTGPVDSPGVWYSVTGTGGLMTASLCGGSTYDTRLTVYQGGCGGLSCVVDANDTCAGGGPNEDVAWCSTSGTAYRILVHGVGGASGSFNLELTSETCVDGDACTRDSCDDTLGDLFNGACVYTPTYSVGVECCDPSDGSTVTIADGNACTLDLCNSATGVVTHPAGPAGPNPGCDDGLRCTVDACAAGVCVNNNINDLNLICDEDVDCPAQTICCPADNPDCVEGFCYCEPHPTLALVPQAGGSPVAGCYAPGETFAVYVEMGLAEEPVVGAQFFIEYDPTTLRFESIDPGMTVDPTSPFALEFNETVNPALGTIDYVIGVNFGNVAQNPTTVAIIEFTAMAECDAYLRFRVSGPSGQPNTFTAPGGVGIGADLINPDPPILSILAEGPTITGCPSNLIVAPDPGELTAVVSWTSPVASDNCDVGTVPVICDPASGSAFPPGTTSVACSAANSCGLPDFCFFDVTVEPPVVTVDIQLSPTMAAGPIQRCITFELWDCDGPPSAQQASVSQDITFQNGLASGVEVDIPGGAWECITARDRLHTLRSTAPDFTTTDGVQFTASFVGNRNTGGHWLVGGNLNDDRFIDILDFGVFFPLFLSPASPNTPCGAAPPNGNINADNVVDLLDLIFISGNSLMASEPACCGGGVASDDGPVASITLRELRSMGLGHMAVADVNRDGVLDMDDMIAFMQGDVPPSGDDSSLREEPSAKPGRGSRGYRTGGR